MGGGIPGDPVVQQARQSDSCGTGEGNRDRRRETRSWTQTRVSFVEKAPRRVFKRASLAIPQTGPWQPCAPRHTHAHRRTRASKRAREGSGISSQWSPFSWPSKRRWNDLRTVRSRVCRAWEMEAYPSFLKILCAHIYTHTHPHTHRLAMAHRPKPPIPTHESKHHSSCCVPLFNPFYFTQYATPPTDTQPTATSPSRSAMYMKQSSYWQC